MMWVVATTTRHLKRQKANTAAFFGDSDESVEVEEQEAIKDELVDYLALPQIKYKTEWEALDCWKEHQKEFPNVAVMARQYLGCPAGEVAVMARLQLPQRQSGCFLRRGRHYLC